MIPRFRVAFKNKGMFEPVCYYISNVYEGVGNVFENPELLEHPDFREE